MLVQRVSKGQCVNAAGGGVMLDPVSLTAVSAAVLTQGIGFLYGQAA